MCITECVLKWSGTDRKMASISLISLSTPKQLSLPAISKTNSLSLFPKITPPPPLTPHTHSPSAPDHPRTQNPFPNLFSDTYTRTQVHTNRHRYIDTYCIAKRRGQARAPAKDSDSIYLCQTLVRKGGGKDRFYGSTRHEIALQFLVYLDRRRTSRLFNFINLLERDNYFP